MTKVTLEGQWFSSFDRSKVQMIAEIDELENCYRGCFYLFEDKVDAIPTVSGAATFETKDKSLDQRLELTPLAINPLTKSLEYWSPAYQENFPGIDFPKKVEVTISIRNGKLVGNWFTDKGRNARISLQRGNTKSKSSIKSVKRISTWAKFKTEVDGYKYGKMIFRGQTEDFALRTTFHRTNRNCLQYYSANDIEVLHRHLSAVTPHYFQLLDNKQYLAFLNLAQHHGYPTPLLDWTYSPFIAAYFAFSEIGKTEFISSNKFVRIYIFDYEAWKSKTIFDSFLHSTRPHLTFLEPISFGNTRMLPQQGLCGLTNVNDIEAYVKFQERTHSVNFLTAIDIPWSERNFALSDLKRMGITAGSLFPGLDGACRSLRETEFQKW